ncbi:MAG: molybdenum cofactor guanylyltransferase [Nitrososphaerota archaeon]|nr:molybdenum cofactor guanylyltransferase [Candidatus Bathyarchaeota archaeon]MDW8023436.1 molybdenum cofactor guanylyltransferase [Nitrososphaerota archaeon]
MGNSAIILAGGLSTRFGQDKGLIPLANKPLIKYVLEAAGQTVDEIVVVVNSKAQADKFSRVLGSAAKILMDVFDNRGPLVGAATGFREVSGEYTLLLPCDTPLVSKEVLQLLLDLCVNKNAVVPRWPNGYIEPLHASYRVKPALEAAENTLREGKRDMRSMIEKLKGVRYVSTLVLQQFDAELKFFVNVNTPLDLKKVEHMLKR